MAQARKAKQDSQNSPKQARSSPRAVEAPGRRIWRIDRPGNLDRLELREEVCPPLAPGEARVRVHAVGLNFADVFALQGLYSATPDGPFTPGLEFAGTVEEIRPPEGRRTGKRTLFRAGDRVMGLTRFGGYSERVQVQSAYLKALPKNWDFAEGAALLAQGLTAWYALSDLGACRPGHTVLVHSAAGGVGLLALDMLRKLGAYPIAVIGRQEKAQLLRERTNLTDEQIIVRDEKAFVAQLQRALEARNRMEASAFGPGLDLVLDSLYGSYFRPAFERLNPGGRHVVFGAATFMTQSTRPNYLQLLWRYLRRPRLDPLQMIGANRSLLAFNLIWLWDRIDELSRLYEGMQGLKLRAPLVGHRFRFADAPEALRFFQSGASQGKVVLEL